MDSVQSKLDCLGDIRLKEGISNLSPDGVVISADQSALAAAPDHVQPLDPSIVLIPHPQCPPLRPNFWLPILLVSSFVVPFFILMFVSTHLSKVPGLPGLVFEFSRTGLKLGLHGTQVGFYFGIFALIPSICGTVFASILDRAKQTDLLFRIFIWFLTMLILVCVVIASGTQFMPG